MVIFCSKIGGVVTKQKVIARVYVRSIPFEVKEDNIYPPSRRDEIMSCGSDKVKRHKFYVWKLLEVALKETFNKSLQEINIHKEGTRWLGEGVYFSLSHSGDAVAVGVSNFPIGVDIQHVHTVRNLSSKIVCKGEEGVDLVELFSKKEAIFKSLGREMFSPSQINTLNSDVASEIVIIGGEEYRLSVASKNREYKQIKLL